MRRVAGAVLTVLERSEELDAGIRSSPDIFRFKMLPFVAVRPGHRWIEHPPPGTRITPASMTGYNLTWAINRLLLEAHHVRRIQAVNGNRWALGIDRVPAYPVWRDGCIDWLPPIQEPVGIAHPAALGLSLQLRQGRVLREGDLLSVATRVAARAMPLVVAAGNWGALGESTLSPLARLPWTIAVGATTGEDGTRRLPESSVGSPDDLPATGVTVVASGENIFVPGTYGTSFAVGRALRQALALTAFLLQIRRLDEAARTGEHGGVPLLQRFQVDTGFRDFDPRPSLPLPLIPILGIDQVAVRACLDTLRDHGASCRVEPSAAVVRRMLIESARPVPGAQPWEVGAGFVDSETTRNYLSRFDGASLAELFIEPSHLTTALLTRLRKYTLANPSELDALEAVAVGSCLAFAIDFRTGRIRAAMRDPSRTPGAHGIAKAESQYRWPPSLE